MKRTLLVSSFAIAFATLLGAASVSASASDDADRAELTRALVNKWSAHVEKAYPIGADAWSVEMAPSSTEPMVEPCWPMVSIRPCRPCSICAICARNTASS